jgi:hypothetical protein
MRMMDSSQSLILGCVAYSAASILLWIAAYLVLQQHSIERTAKIYFVIKITFSSISKYFCDENNPLLNLLIFM